LAGLLNATNLLAVQELIRLNDAFKHAGSARNYVSGVLRFVDEPSASTFGANSDILRAVELGAQAWDLTKDSCDFGDITTITPVYDGTTDLLAGAQDSVNTVDKGSMASFGCEGSIACTQVWYDPTGTVEADIRFSDRVRWSTSGKAGAYDYRSVATHEFGHFIGLSDLHDSPNLTMYYATDTGSTGPRTLGRGDVLGLRALYP